MEEVITGAVRQILNSMNAGVYLTDVERRIVFWNKRAEDITGHKAQDVVGRSCGDNILVHVDKEGRPLCSTGLCPLHRSMATGRASERPIVVYGKSASGRRIPLSTSVAPVCDEDGTVIGGVEVFRDETVNMRQQELARIVQRFMLPENLPSNDQISFAFDYSPMEVIGGDFCHVADLSGGVYGLFLADVAGHGTSAALLTALLHSLVHECADQMGDPARFLSALNTRLYERTSEEGMVTALAMTFDCSSRTATCAAAGHPPALLQPGDGGAVQIIDCSGLPLGIAEEADFETVSVTMSAGDRVLGYTDGAVEILIDDHRRLGTDGLIEVLADVPQDGASHRLTALYHLLMERCARPDAEDDVTLISCIMF